MGYLLFEEYSMRTLLVVLAVLLSMVPALAARAEEPASISTSGQSTVYVVPDKVVITLGVQSYEPSLDKAKADNEAASAQMAKAVRELGINANDIGTDQLTVEIRYKNNHETDIE